MNWDAINWDAVGALAEVFGVVAVVVSLVYLARQLRMTRQVDQVAAFQSIFDGFNHQMTRFFGARDDLASRGLSDRRSLNEAERLKFDHLLEALVNQTEMTGIAVDAGLMGDEDLEPLEWWFREKLFCHPGAREWLEDYQHAYAAPFLERLRRASASAQAKAIDRPDARSERKGARPPKRADT